MLILYLLVTYFVVARNVVVSLCTGVAKCGLETEPLASYSNVVVVDKTRDPCSIANNNLYRTDTSNTNITSHWFVCREKGYGIDLCEGGKESLSCSGTGGVINIISAFYGRTTRRICPHSHIITANCRRTNDHDLTIVKHLCDGRTSCEVNASNGVFGDPCGNTYKYLEVVYNCVNGETYQSLEYLYRIPKSTIRLIIPETCDVIYRVLKDTYLKVPDTNAAWQKIADEFEEKWNFPNCIGAIDGKHVVVRSPPGSGSTYFNYKGHFSIILLAIVDADYNFVYVDVGRNGRTNDAGVFSRSPITELLETRQLNIPPPKPLQGWRRDIPYVLVGDDAFPLKDYLLKPYPNRQLDNEKRIFNYRLSRARRIVENVFGILSSLFGVFQKALPFDPEVVTSVVLDACVLHNFLLQSGWNI